MVATSFKNPEEALVTVILLAIYSILLCTYFYFVNG